MAAITPNVIHICRLRITRLTELGAIVAGPNNHVVTDMPMSLGLTPENEEGEERTLRNGCDSLVVQFKAPDEYKRMNLTLEMAAMDPALSEMLTGGTLFTNAGGDPIGVTWPTPGGDPSYVAVEAWADTLINSAPDTTYPYLRFVFPSSSWAIDEMTMENDFMTPNFTGFSRVNDTWVDPYQDLPTGVTDASGPDGTGGWFYDDGPLPTVVRGYSSYST